MDDAGSGEQLPKSIDLLTETYPELARRHTSCCYRGHALAAEDRGPLMAVFRDLWPTILDRAAQERRPGGDVSR
jgi:hypothetical protein